MTLQIFLCHSHKDNKWCDEFVAELNKYDVDIWYDRQDPYADAQWVRTIQKELPKRDMFLIILTPNAQESERVSKELALALASKKPIIGIIHKPTSISDSIIQRQTINAIGKSGPEVAKYTAQKMGLTIKQIPNSTRQRSNGTIPNKPSEKPLEILIKRNPKLWEQYLHVIAKQLNIATSQITPDTNFRFELPAGPLALIELIMAYEEFFDIEISDEEIQDIQTVKDGFQLLLRKTTIYDQTQNK